MPAPTHDQDRGQSEDALRYLFRHEEPWCRAPEAVTDLIAARFSRTYAMAIIELFECCAVDDLVRRHLMPICRKHRDPAVALGFFAQTLYNYGSAHSKELFGGPDMPSARAEELYWQAHSLFSCAVTMEPHYFPAMFGMAVLHGSRRDFKTAMTFCRSALADLEYIATEPLDRLSAFERGARSGGVDPIRAQINAYLSDISRLTGNRALPNRSAGHLAAQQRVEAVTDKYLRRSFPAEGQDTCRAPSRAA